MPGLLAPVDIYAVRGRILTSSQDLDAMAKHLLTSLGFTDGPAQWPLEVERVLTDLAGSARLAVVQQICATAQSFRDNPVEKETDGHSLNIAFQRTQFKWTLDLLTGLMSTDAETFDTECRNIIRSHLPELDQKSAAFDEDVALLEAMEAELLPSYTILAVQRLDLEAALNAWLHIEIPGDLVLAGKVATLQLSMMANERQAIVDRAEALMLGLHPSHGSPTQEDQVRVYEELRNLARSLAVQVSDHRRHLTAIANAVRTLQCEFPALCVRGVDIAVWDLLAVRGKHSMLEARLAEMSECSEQLRQMLGCVMNILWLDVHLDSYKRSSAT